MATLKFRIVNVFTFQGGRLTGNPLCVFENAAGLDTDTMQALARQFNLSETTFISASSAANAHVRGQCAGPRLQLYAPLWRLR